MAEIPDPLFGIRSEAKVVPALDAVLAAAEHLRPTDDALAALLRRIASDIDALDQLDPAATARHARLMAELLDKAGLSPAGRRTLGMRDDAEPDDPLLQLLEGIQ